jgi:hypothetical protein
MARQCLLCARPAVPGGSRCVQHRRGNWERRRPVPGAYFDPVYVANRAKLLEGKTPLSLVPDGTGHHC